MLSESSGKTLVVTCDESIDISVVGELHQRLIKALDEEQAVEIDAGSVERADAAVLQTFYAFVREARGQGMRVQWRNASNCFVEAADLLGLIDVLGLSKD